MIVEDDPATGARLADMIGRESDLCVSGLADCCAQAVRMLDGGVHDVMLTDLGLPDGSGLDLIRKVHREYPDIETMVITVFGDESHVMAAIEAGATGYLLKDGSPSYVAASIRDLLAGGSPISPAIARHMLRRFVGTPARSARDEVMRPAQNGPRIQLTPKEVEVLQQIAKGFSYAEIAETLSVSVHTVTTHIKHLYRKLAVRSRTEAVFEAVQLGLINVSRQD